MRTEIVIHHPWRDRGRILLRAGASTVAIIAFLLALKSYGATELLIQYRTALLILMAAGLGVSLTPGVLLRDRRFQLFLLVGIFLLVQVWRMNTLEARGYVLLSLGWSVAFLTLTIVWNSMTGFRVMTLLLIVSGSLEALYGLVQALGGVDFIGNYERDLGNLATGTFINHNHFAGFLNMVIPFAVGALVAGFTERRRRRLYTHSEAYAWGWIVLLASAFMGLAVLLSQSRGGTTSLAISLLLLGILLAIKKKRGGVLSGWAISILILLTFGLGAWVGVSTLLERFGQVDVDLPTRIQVYQGTLEMVADYPWLGVGPGMFGWRFRPYQLGHTETLFLHTHNDYFQTAVEWGIPAAVLFWLFVLWRLRGAVRTSLSSLDPWTQGMALGCAGAITSILLHSLVDFNLQIPANWMVFSSILGLSWSIEEHETRFEPGQRGRGFLSRAAGGMIAIRLVLVFFLLTAGWSIYTRWSAMEVFVQNPTLGGVLEAIERDSSGPEFHFLAGLLYRDQIDHLDSQKALQHLEYALHLNPYSWRYWLEMGRTLELVNHEKAEEAYLRALELNPGTATYHWRMANFYIRQEAFQDSIPHLLNAVSLNVTYQRAALGLLWRIGLDSEEISSFWPTDRNSRLQLLGFLTEQAERTSSPQLSRNIDEQWEHLLRVGSQVRVDDSRTYFNYLFKKGDFSKLRERWIDLKGREGIDCRSYRECENLVWNGDFERPSQKGILDWQLIPGQGYELSVEENQGFNGTSGLVLRFHGTDNLNFSGVRQTVILKPEEKYHYSFFARSEDLSTEQGLFLEIVDGATQKAILWSPQIIGTTEWKMYRGSFSTSPDTGYVTIRLRRRTSRRIDNQLEGTAYFDRISVKASLGVENEEVSSLQ